MRTNNKDTVAILIHIPRNLYEDYLRTLWYRDLKRQSYNAKLFINAVKFEISEFNRYRGDK